MGVDFSQAFRILLGDAWYAVAETLFVVSCMVQVCPDASALQLSDRF